MSWDQDADRPKRRRRAVNLAGPLILITLGLVFLTANLGILGTSPWQLLWQWWPLILIVIGLEILIGVLGRCPARSAGLWSYAFSAILGVLVVVGTVALVAYLLLMGPQFAIGTPEYTSRLTQSLGDVTRAEVSLDLILGTFRVSALPSETGSLLEGEFTGFAGTDSDSPPVSREYQETGGVGILTLKSEGPRARLGGDWPQWHLRLSPDVPLTLQVDAVMGTYDLDLRDLQVTEMKITGVMATKKVQLPTRGRATVYVDGVMETVEIVVPAETAARIHTKGLAAINVDEGRFPRRGEVNESADFDAATNRVEIYIESVMSTVRVR